MDDNKIKQLRQEQKELNTLINKGVTFDVDDTGFEVKKYLFGLIKKRKPVSITRHFKIEEPTLGTLDRLSAEWIEFAIDEEQMKGEEGMSVVHKMVHEHAVRCAKIIAIAVMGSEYLIPTPGKNGVIHYREDTKSLEELTALFARTIKPSKMYQVYVLISAMANLGDFSNSIRLIGINRTTMPNRIEENNAD